MPIRLLIFTIAGTILISAISAFSSGHSNLNTSNPVLKLENKDISLMVVNTSESRTHGLSDMTSLPANSAMLFVFEEPDRYGIWMKDMKFPIDILWLDESKKIIHIEQNVSPDTYPNVFFPSEKSLYVLETNINFVKENNLTIGKVLNILEK